MQCVALKEFTANGENIQRNQLVDGDEFRNSAALLSQRYIRPATQDEIASAYDPEQEKPSPAPMKAKMRARKKR